MPTKIHNSLVYSVIYPTFCVFLSLLVVVADNYSYLFRLKVHIKNKLSFSIISYIIEFLHLRQEQTARMES